jgi:hypothetical protein
MRPTERVSSFLMPIDPAECPEQMKEPPLLSQWRLSTISQGGGLNRSCSTRRR